MFQIIWSAHECHKIFNSVYWPYLLHCWAHMLSWLSKGHRRTCTYTRLLLPDPIPGITTTSIAATLDWCAVHGMYQIQSPNIINTIMFAMHYAM